MVKKKIIVEVTEDFHSKVKDRAKLLDLSMKEYVTQVLDDNLKFNSTKDVDMKSKNFNELRELAANSPLPNIQYEAEKELTNRLRGLI